MKFRKKPVVIEAEQFTPANLPTVMAFTKELGDTRLLDVSVAGITMTIKTLEGDMLASEGDWIVKGIAGEFYPCKFNIFEATYEEVTE